MSISNFVEDLKKSNGMDGLNRSLMKQYFKDDNLIIEDSSLKEDKNGADYFVIINGEKKSVQFKNSYGICDLWFLEYKANGKDGWLPKYKKNCPDYIFKVDSESQKITNHGIAHIMTSKQFLYSIYLFELDGQSFFYNRFGTAYGANIRWKNVKNTEITF